MIIFETTSDIIDVVKRLDFHYWNPQEHDPLNGSSLGSVVGRKNIDCSAFYPAITPFYEKQSFASGKVPFVRVKDTRRLLLDLSSSVFLDEDLLAEMAAHIKQVAPGDVLITKGGEYIGDAALAPSTYSGYAISRDVLAIRCADSKISGAYLCAFFQSAPGKSELVRTRSVQGQPHLTIDKIAQIPIPYFGNDFEKEVCDYYSAFFRLIESAQEHLEAARQILNASLLGALDVPAQMKILTRDMSAAELMQRMDVGFYQQEWSSLVVALSAQGIEFEAVMPVKAKLERTNLARRFKYVTLADIDELSGIIGSPTELSVAELPDRAQRAIRVGDVLVSSVRGSKEKIALVPEELDDQVASTGFYVIRGMKLLPEVVYAICRSKYYDLFIEQMASGSIMSSISDKYFSRLTLPIIDQLSQERIRAEVKQYFSMWSDAFDAIGFARSMFEDAISSGRLSK